MTIDELRAQAQRANPRFTFGQALGFAYGELDAKQGIETQAIKPTDRDDFAHGYRLGKQSAAGA